uniref:ARAD1C41668p n=1 Tax=Blastobotrys adeninivorans TaxID=409370 RepID=A0A060T4L3_BLAAD
MTSHVVYGSPIADTDSKARRFHGAFTGGFSAGWFNSVGSKEGWAPSSFSVTRDKSGSKITKGGRPSDAHSYMDEEDLADQETKIVLVPKFEISPMTSQKDLLSRALGTPLNTIGYDILRRMGWKQGQGIGPKVLRPVKVGSEVNNNDSRLHEFAPTEAPALEMKNMKSKDKAKLPKKRKLAMNISISSSYDEEDDDDDGELFTKRPKGELRRLNQTGPKFVTRGSSSRLISYHQKTWDDAPPLQGFQLTIEPIKLTKLDPVTVPEDFQPDNAYLSSNTEPRLGSNPPQTKLRPSQRSDILGEAKIPGKSIFEYMAPQERAKLVSLTGKDLPEAKGLKHEQVESKADHNVPSIPLQIAQQALESQRKPYQEDPVKQKRYIEYLQYQAELKDLPEKFYFNSQELREFSQVALVFRPLNSMLSTKFTQSSLSQEPSSSAQVQAALREEYGQATRIVEEFIPDRLLCKRMGVPYDPPPTAGSESINVRKSTRLPIPEPPIPGPVTITTDRAPATKSQFVRGVDKEKASPDLFQKIFGDQEEEL